LFMIASLTVILDHRGHETAPRTIRVCLMLRI
jgi:hypothetical protein